MTLAQSAFGPSIATGALIPIAIVSILAVCAVVLVWLSGRARDRRRRQDLIEAALRNPALTPESQRELIRAIKPRTGRATFVLGWFGLFGGIAWLISDPRGEEFTWAVVASLMSFACITLPVALRELEARRA